MAVEEMRKGKRKFEKKGRDVNYAERRWMLQKTLKNICITIITIKRSCHILVNKLYLIR